ncbi:MAG: hypothetical protein ACYTFY_22145, partial [Planctomycetota bacterium]
KGENKALIEAEVDLINDEGRGIPTIFRRDVSINVQEDCLNVCVIESIEYVGVEELTNKEILLAPWTLCQFDSGPGYEVTFPECENEKVWDLYDASDEQRYVEDGLIHTKTDGAARYQIAMDKDTPWIELNMPDKGIKVKRSAESLPEGQDYIDIIDAPPEEKPSDKGVRFSVYSDTDMFMEIEACGGCPEVFKPGTVMSVGVRTEYCKE